MKRILLSGVAIAASFGLATTASAQTGSNYHYSSYGYTHQEAAQDAVGQAASPSDAPTPAVPGVPGAMQAPTVQAAPPSLQAAGCDAGGSWGSIYGAGYGGVGGGCDNGGCANGGCADGGCAGGGCGLGGIGSGDLLHSRDRNVVFGIRGLIFDRDYEDDRGLGSNAAGQYFFSTQADHDVMGGFEANLASRNCSGFGWEINYFGLYPDDADVIFAGPPLFSDLTAFQAVDLAGVSVWDALNNASSWRLYRSTEIHNLELNLLRNGGQTCGLLGGTANIEWIAGLRWFRFDENLRLAANGAAAPFLTLYDVETHNDLLGVQLGARIERCICDNWTWTFGTKFGLYNNDIDSCQWIQDGNGTVATVPSGPVNYSFKSDKDDIATLGELDFGLNCQFNPCTRFNFGYRALGITSIALAADQIPYNGNDTEEIQRIKSNGNLLLHGFYFGLERSF
jgi:hypothetical protein